jgi:hypothetical protein
MYTGAYMTQQGNTLNCERAQQYKGTLQHQHGNTLECEPAHLTNHWVTRVNCAAAAQDAHPHKQQANTTTHGSRLNTP